MIPDNPRETSDTEKGKLQSYLKYSGLAFQMLMVLGIAAYAGMRLDAYLGNKNPWFTIAFMLLGVIGSIYKIIISVMK
ncbi:AtpZ/AtpI family protein [Adhaeribacter radiodurans]|uniref:AtpZ/AtpI family protein n=1 Tax=Adhaeribacter radiodurans TaxID=2745197 RepID=A0A7L7L276_9BACT|nr:AtpZ/AtpI family protein [Adhaeribacter radiodurans]QMU26897.1 AtpZ/AtpI family protein [Adhaeribacter radiodurans]